MKTLLLYAFLMFAGWSVLALLGEVWREGSVPRAVIEALDVAPPLKLDYLTEPALLIFGERAFVSITNTSDKAVHPSSITAATAEGKKHNLAAPLVIKEHESVKLELPYAMKKGCEIEVTCLGFPIPRSLTFVK